MRAEAKPRDGWVSGNPQDHIDGSDAPTARIAFNSSPLAALVTGWDLPCQGTFHDLEGNAGIWPENQTIPKGVLWKHEMAAREPERPGAQKTQLIRNTNTSPPPGHWRSAAHIGLAIRVRQHGNTGEPGSGLDVGFYGLKPVPPVLLPAPNQKNINAISAKPMPWHAKAPWQYRAVNTERY